MFHVGQKVVCVDVALRHCDGAGLASLLTIGAIYTVRDFDRRAADVHGAPTLRLEEIRGPEVLSPRGLWEIGFYPDRFRPVTEKKTDISCFTRILDKVNKREPVNG